MRIAITGIGIVSAIGNNCAETLQSLLEQRSGIGPMRYLHSVHTEYPVGEVQLSNDELRQRLNLGDEPLPRTSLLGIMAARIRCHHSPSRSRCIYACHHASSSLPFRGVGGVLLHPFHRLFLGAQCHYAGL